MLCEDESRDWDDVFMSQGMSRIASNSPEVGQECGTDFPHNTQKEPILLDVGLLASRTMRQYISVLSTQFWGLYYIRPSKLI